jgi:threonine/homoserine efflux transporter RhtA
MMALRRMDMGAFSILMSLEPAFGAVFGYLILHQILSAQQIMGILLVMGASIGAVYLAPSRTTASTGVMKLHEPPAAAAVVPVIQRADYAVERLRVDGNDAPRRAQ